MLSAIRYVGAGCIASHRWFPPAVTYGLALVATDAAGGPMLPTLATSAAILLPVSAWMTVTTVNFEDPAHSALTAACLGGVVRARVGALLAALVGSLLLVVPSMLLAYASNHSDFGIRAMGVGIVMHFLTAFAGVSVASLCVQPVIRSRGWTAALLLAATTVFLVVPGLPPIRALLQLVDSDQPPHLGGGLAGVGLETVGASVLCVVVAMRLTRRAT